MKPTKRLAFVATMMCLLGVVLGGAGCPADALRPECDSDSGAVCFSQTAVSPGDILPADGEVEGWSRMGAALDVTADADLYAQIDGAAPKYIDHGWKRSSFAQYGKNNWVIDVAVHDMAIDENAETLFNFDLPVSRVNVDGAANTAIDLGQPTAYRSQAFVGRYYIQISIDDRSDAALAAIQAFTKAAVARAQKR